MISPIIPPGSTIGILGGGQLGRMTVLAAAALGYRSHVFTDHGDSPAAQVTPRVTVAGFDDDAALDRFAEAVDVITLEWENVPVSALERLAQRRPVRPGPSVLATTQDRIAEKSFLNQHTYPTAPWRPVRTSDALAEALRVVMPPAVLKTARLGYDGKGQIRIEHTEGATEAWQRLSGHAAILEAFVEFDCEISVIAARGPDGTVVTYPPVRNIHENHILARTLVPAGIGERAAVEAQRIARGIAEALDVTGLLAVEMFVTAAGEVLVNELAPRPHNSGHWSIDAAATSQFEQLIRAICGLPLGDTRALVPAEMTNLLGGSVEQWLAVSADHLMKLHLYGKTHSRPGRKMGHITRLKLPGDVSATG